MKFIADSLQDIGMRIVLFAYRIYEYLDKKGKINALYGN